MHIDVSGLSHHENTRKQRSTCSMACFCPSFPESISDGSDSMCWIESGLILLSHLPPAVPSHRILSQLSSMSTECGGEFPHDGYDRVTYSWLVDKGEPIDSVRHHETEPRKALFHALVAKRLGRGGLPLPENHSFRASHVRWIDGLYEHGVESGRKIATADPSIAIAPHRNSTCGSAFYILRMNYPASKPRRD